MFPARAGMDRPDRLGHLGDDGVPRACGDGPLQDAVDLVPEECSLRVRGWAGVGLVALAMCVVFPARVGMGRARC